MIEKIKELFYMLSRTDQLQLLRELNSSTEVDNPIREVNDISQVQYGENIKFEISNQGSDLQPEILAKLSTPWGEFTGKGANKKIAKTMASQRSLEALK